MVVFKLTFISLVIYYGVSARGSSPPLCTNPDEYSSRRDENGGTQADICPPSVDCKPELVKYVITKNSQAKQLEWRFDETSTCLSCLPTCCSNLPAIFGGFDNNVCDEYLKTYGYQKTEENAWIRHDDEVLTYLVTKYQTENDFNVFLRLPSQSEICAYVINNHMYLEKRCNYIGASNARGATCPEGETRNGDMCVKSVGIGL
ncbi:hypothetical protein EVAR_66053_1 [Eumeta japonica]|uniref:Uncharacterized protein n=1 Tax=Eumeta variegata TaxID=151549 RepID=A0A4C2ACB7_EUMVA|nr:hypothetical protein EVAR_66053_1 [Eumeta japonica]